MSKEQEIRRLLLEVVRNFGEAAKEFKLLTNEEILEPGFLDTVAVAGGLMEQRRWRLQRIHQLLVAEQLEAECDSGK